MSTNPINLAIRFLLEATSLVAMGLWGYNLHDSWYQIILAIGIPLIAAILWGVFAVPEDPSRSGKTVIATPGILRLFLELAFFGFAGWIIFDLEYIRLGWIFCTIAILHYIISYDRMVWLLTK